MKFTHTAIAAACLVVAPFAMATGTTGNAQRAHTGSTMHMSNGGMHDSATVRQLQQQLAQRGYDPGPVDGQYGPRTRAAVEEFQRSQGISAQGLDAATMTALGVDAAAGSSPGNSSAPGEGSLGSSPNQQPPAGGNIGQPERPGNTTTMPRDGTSRGDSSSPGEGALGGSPSQTNPSPSTTPADATRPGNRSDIPANPATPAGPAGGTR